MAQSKDAASRLRAQIQKAEARKFASKKQIQTWWTATKDLLRKELGEESEAHVAFDSVPFDATEEDKEILLKRFGELWTQWHPILEDAVAKAETKPPAPTPVEGGVRPGDVVFWDYEMWLVAPDGKEELRGTTKETLAKEHGLAGEARTYEPEPVLLDEGHLLRGLYEDLLQAKVGEERTVVLPPEKAHGERDPKLLQLFPIREFHRQEIDPHPGMEVTVRGRRGTVQAVTAGRVRVDFNNPLAGRTVRYRYMVQRAAADDVEKARAILRMEFGAAEDFVVEAKGNDAEIVLPDIAKADLKWFSTKMAVVEELRKHTGFQNIRFVEVYSKREAAPEAETSSEAAGEAPAEPAAEEKS